MPSVIEVRPFKGFRKIAGTPGCYKRDIVQIHTPDFQAM